MAALVFSFLRSLLPRKVGHPLPTMHSLRVHARPAGGSPCGSFSAAAGQRPARVVRVLRGAPGRLVISGRMADVCAELDRLSAAESACGPQAFAPTR